MEKIVGEKLNKNEIENERIQKVISGGQTGADRAGLEAARKLGIVTGGIAPKGFLTEKGKDITLGTVFGLMEDQSTDYVKRSKLNVDHSDGTIAFRIQYSHGTDNTIGYAQTKKWKKGTIQTMKNGYKPICCITNVKNKKKAIEDIKKFIRENKIKCVNICGHRQSGVKQMNFQEVVKEILLNSLI
jgi:hypothetical protein